MSQKRSRSQAGRRSPDRSTANNPDPAVPRPAGLQMSRLPDPALFGGREWGFIPQTVVPGRIGKPYCSMQNEVRWTVCNLAGQVIGSVAHMTIVGWDKGYTLHLQLQGQRAQLAGAIEQSIVEMRMQSSISNRPVYQRAIGKGWLAAEHPLEDRRCYQEIHTVSG